MKILFFMAHAGHARNFEWTLRILAERGHAVHVALDRDMDADVAGRGGLLPSLAAEYPRLTLGPAPARRRRGAELLAEVLRASLDYLRYLEPEFADAAKLRSRAGGWLPERLRAVADRALVRSPRARRAARRALEAAYAALPVGRSVGRFVRDRDPDVVVVTPLVDLPSFQGRYVRAARRLGIPTCLPVASWDNLTTKGLIHDLPDVVSVWCDAQREEAVALHGVPTARVVVTGAVPYDHWFGWRPTPRSDFCSRVGLDPEQPFVLYVGSSPFIAPAESAFVARWVAGLRADAGGPLRDVQILVRPHPQNPLSAPRANGAPAGRVVTHPPAGADPTDAPSRTDYFDAMFHAAAVVGINTSALIESSIVGRPVHTLLAPEFRDTQAGTLHFHHLLPENGGALRVATTLAEHGEQLRRSLALDDVAAADDVAFVARFVRPFGLDEPASPRLVDLIEGLAQTGVPSAARTRSAMP